VKYAIYAIVSESFVRQMIEAPALELDRVAVLVKTRRFKSVAELPKQPGVETVVQGLAINQIHSLSDQEANLVRQVVPGIDLEKVVILEEGRRPKSQLQSLSIAAGGALFLLLGLGSFFMERAFAKRDEASAVAAAKAAITSPPATDG
jgi:hypothetical protein